MERKASIPLTEGSLLAGRLSGGRGQGAALLANWKHLWWKAFSRIQGPFGGGQTGAISRVTPEFLQMLEGPREPPACTPRWVRVGVSCRRMHYFPTTTPWPQWDSPSFGQVHKSHQTQQAAQRRGRGPGHQASARL